MKKEDKNSKAWDAAVEETRDELYRKTVELFVDMIKAGQVIHHRIKELEKNKNKLLEMRSRLLGTPGINDGKVDPSVLYGIIHEFNCSELSNFKPNGR